MQKQQCNVVQEQQCQEKWRDETQNYSETQCSTQYKEDCEYQWEGTGNNKVWAAIPGTCKSNPYDHCEDVQKQAVKQVPYTDCQAVPKQVKYFIHLPKYIFCDRCSYQKCFFHIKRWSWSLLIRKKQLPTKILFLLTTNIELSLDC